MIIDELKLNVLLIYVAVNLSREILQILCGGWGPELSPSWELAGS